MVVAAMSANVDSDVGASTRVRVQAPAMGGCQPDGDGETCSSGWGETEESEEFVFLP